MHHNWNLDMSELRSKQTKQNRMKMQLETKKPKTSHSQTF